MYTYMSKCENDKIKTVQVLSPGNFGLDLDVVDLEGPDKDCS
jgi:hypothetical protein